jgi:hypothetical protein
MLHKIDELLPLLIEFRKQSQSPSPRRRSKRALDDTHDVPRPRRSRSRQSTEPAEDASTAPRR